MLLGSDITWQEMVEARCEAIGEARGEERGKARGKISAAREIIQSILLNRFGALPEKMLATLEACSKGDFLTNLAVAAAQVESLADFEKLMQDKAE